MTDLASLDHELNHTILSGQIMAAFEKHYADDIVMQENANDPVAGKEANRIREQAFVDSVAEFHGASVGATAVEGDVSFSEWVLDVTFQDGGRKKLQQVAVRRWRDGQVVHERFYFDTAG